MKPAPLVTVCLPVLNQRPFLDDRFRSFDRQSFRDFEVVACDNLSGDGTWEWLQERASHDSTLSLHRRERAGMYDNWNACIQHARGRFLYFAPADDLMADDCLGKLATALLDVPGADLADSRFATVDEAGRPMPAPELATHEDAFFGETWSRRHVREPPHDVPVISRLAPIHRSITQVMVTRDLVDRIGRFRTDLGSDGDWEWHLRSAFVARKVFVPEPLSQWRRWPGQATKDAIHNTVAYAQKRLRMIRLARATVAASALGRDPFSKSDLESEVLRELTLFAAREGRTTLAAGLLLRHPGIALDALRRRFGDTWEAQRLRSLRRVIARHNLAGCIRLL